MLFLLIFKLLQNILQVNSNVGKKKGWGGEPMIINSGWVIFTVFRKRETEEFGLLFQEYIENIDFWQEGHWGMCNSN